MNKKFCALSLSCLMMTSVVACGDTEKADISDISSAAKKIIGSDYSGIVASDANYSMTDSEAIGYRRDISRKADVDFEWLIIADEGELEIFYADNWDDKADCHKDAENPDELTLDELYEKNISKYQPEEEDEDTDGYMGYIEKSKRSSANSSARSLARALDSAFIELDEMGYDVSEIGYVSFADGKVTGVDKVYQGNDEVIQMIESDVSDYFNDVVNLPCAVAFCTNGYVSEVYWAEDYTSNISGCYPVDEDYYDYTFEEVVYEKEPYYHVEPEKKPSNSIGDTDVREFNLLVYGNIYEEPFYNTFYEWIYENDLDIELNIINTNSSSSDCAERLRDMIISGETVDAAIIDPDNSKYFSNDGCFYPLSVCGISQDDYAACYPYTIDMGTDDYGEVYTLSVSSSPAGYFYHADLAEQYFGIRTPEEMQALIGSWDKFAAAGDTLYDATGGRVAMADSIAGMATAFNNGRTELFINNGSFSVTSEAQNFIDIANKMWAKGSVLHNSAWSGEWSDSFNDGSCLGVFMAEWGGHTEGVLNDYGKYTGGDWAFCQGPTAYFWGGDCLGVPITAQDPELSGSFINYCVNNIEGSYSFLSTYVGVSSRDDVNQVLASEGCSYNYITTNQDIIYDLNNVQKAIPSVSKTADEVRCGWTFASLLSEYINKNGQVSAADIEAGIMKEFR